LYTYLLPRHYILDESTSLRPPVDFVQTGEMSSFSCPIAGSKKWTFNGGPLPQNIKVIGVRILINNVGPANVGEYQCVTSTHKHEIFLATGHLDLKGDLY